MSLIIDDREDRAINDYLSRFGIPTMVARLDFGDMAIQSADGRLIGYERKRLLDLINSMKDRRLSGYQLRGMWKLYDRVELVIEGIWRPGDDGSLEVPNGGARSWQTLYHLGAGISFRQLDSYLYSQYEMGGVSVWRTGSVAETAHLYASRWHWWQKDYDLHKSHDVLFSNNPSAQKRGAVVLAQGDPCAVTMMAAQIPSIDSVAWDIGKHFKSPAEMCLADEDEWRRVSYTDRKGNVKRFGKDRAKGIVQWLRQEK